MPIRIIIAILIVISLSGCTPDIIRNNNYNFNTTLGQELIDLKKALDEGAVDKKEYKEMVESIKQSRFNE